MQFDNLTQDNVEKLAEVFKDVIEPFNPNATMQTYCSKPVKPLTLEDVRKMIDETLKAREEQKKLMRKYFPCFDPKKQVIFLNSGESKVMAKYAVPEWIKFSDYIAKGKCVIVDRFQMEPFDLGIL